MYISFGKYNNVFDVLERVSLKSLALQLQGRFLVNYECNSILRWVNKNTEQKIYRKTITTELNRKSQKPLTNINLRWNFNESQDLWKRYNAKCSNYDSLKKITI